MAVPRPSGGTESGLQTGLHQLPRPSPSSPLSERVTRRATGSGEARWRCSARAPLRKGGSGVTSHGTPRAGVAAPREHERASQPPCVRGWRLVKETARMARPPLPARRFLRRKISSGNPHPGGLPRPGGGGRRARDRRPAGVDVAAGGDGHVQLEPGLDQRLAGQLDPDGVELQRRLLGDGNGRLGEVASTPVPFTFDTPTSLGSKLYVRWDSAPWRMTGPVTAAACSTPTPKPTPTPTPTPSPTPRPTPHANPQAHPHANPQAHSHSHPAPHGGPDVGADSGADVGSHRGADGRASAIPDPFVDQRLGRAPPHVGLGPAPPRGAAPRPPPSPRPMTEMRHRSGPWPSQSTTGPWPCRSSAPRRRSPSSGRPPWS